MTLIIPENSKRKIPIQQAMNGVMNAFHEGTTATDIVIVAVDRKTGEFAMSGFPKQDFGRQIEVMTKALDRLKQLAG